MEYNETLEYILKKYGKPTTELPIKIEDSRHRGMLSLFKDLNFKIGAEIGVETGYFSKEICKANPQLKLFCVDPWHIYDEYIDHNKQSTMDKLYDETVAKLAAYNVEIIRKTSLEAEKGFAANSLDFVFIDGNHDFEFVVNDIIYWTKKVRPGGLVCGHDYKRDNGTPPVHIPFHVIEAITAYTAAYRIKPWFIWTKDKCPSWMFVKPKGYPYIFQEKG